MTLGLPDPTGHRLAQSVVAVADKTLPDNVNRKAPVTPHVITALLHKLTKTNLPLIKQVIVTAAVFAFFTFARMNDLQTLLEGDVIEFQTHIEVYFNRAKNEQRRHGNLVCLDNRAQDADPADRLSLGEALQA